jgi:putative Holliday junction resolvase
MKQVLGIDYGTVRIGLALADRENRIARPLRTLDAQKGLMPNLKRIISDERVELVVLGRPTRSMGEPGSLDDRILHFASVIQSWGVELVFQEESYSSQRADLILKSRQEAGLRDRTAGGIDALAAMIILQDWLDADVSQDGSHA